MNIPNNENIQDIQSIQDIQKNLNINNVNNQYEKSDSIVLDLEVLSMRYRNLLNEYQFAVSNYINYLNEEEARPCGSYTGTSTNIDQQCINNIWKSAGCGSGTLKQPSLSNSSTLNDIIKWAFGMASSNSYNNRIQCYGNGGNSYIIIGVGTDGNLWSRQGLDAPWEKINDNSNGNLNTLCTGNDGKTIYGITTKNTIWTKSAWDASSWNTLPNTNNDNIYSLAQGQDGTYVGVRKGFMNVKGTIISNPAPTQLLWSNSSVMFSKPWVQTSSQIEGGITSIAIAPDGSIFMNFFLGFIFKKNSYNNLTSENWVLACNTRSDMIAITIAPDGTFIGVGNDNQLYTKGNYQDLSGPWQGPYNTENWSCCVTGITTVANPNYNSSDYNQASQANYNINAQPFTTVKNSAYWGTSGVGQINSTTLQECQAMCSSTNGCTGATFNSGTCFLRGGNSTLTAASDTEVAILPKGQHYLSIIQNIDIQLTEINTQIQDKTNNGQPLYETQTQERVLQTQNLISQFLQLVKERTKLDEMVGEYQTLDKEQIEGDIMINQNYYSFILLLALAIIIIIVLYFFNGSTTSAPSSNSQAILQTGGKLGRNAYYLVFGIILLMFITNYSFKKLMN